MNQNSIRTWTCPKQEDQAQHSFTIIWVLRKVPTTSFSLPTKVINNSFFLGINFYFCVEISSAPGGLCVRKTAPAIGLVRAETLVEDCRTETDTGAGASACRCGARVVVGTFVDIVSFHQSSLLLTIFLSAGTFDTWWMMSNISNKNSALFFQNYPRDLARSECSSPRLAWSRSSRTWRQRCRSWSRWRRPPSRPRSPPSSAPGWRTSAPGYA